MYEESVKMILEVAMLDVKETRFLW